MASTGGHGSGRRASPAIYRRRRLAVLILALLVVAALAAGGAMLAGALVRGADTTAEASAGPDASVGTDGPTGAAVPAPSTPAPATTSAAPSSAGPSASSSTERKASPTAQPTPTSSGGCDAATVVVGAETDRDSYGADEDPVLTLVVRNRGTEPCTVNVGTSQMQFEITSGSERIFSSTDCQQASQDLERTIAPGREERATFEWSRNRTVPGCSTVDEQPAAGEYTVTTRLGARTSSPVGFTLR